MAGTPLHAAAGEGHVGVVMVLLSKGARVDPRASGGRTPLYVADQAGHTHMVNVLLSKGG